MSERRGVRNPRTGQIDYWIIPPTEGQLGQLCARMREAQTEWWEGGLNRRIDALIRWKHALLSHRDEVIAALVTDTGRWKESVLEFDMVVSSIDRWCDHAPGLLSTGEKRATAIPFIQRKNEYVPYSLVGVISPWNFPLLLSTIDAVPALLAGCAVIVKPSEIAPRFIQPLARTIASIPELAARFAYVEGAETTGAALIEQVDLVCFTGSTATGRKVAAAAAHRFIPCFLELGGKDPAVVLAGADLESTTSAILWASVVNAGQSCLSIERVYVAESLFDRFVDLLVEKARRLELAYPAPDSGEIGPIISENQARLIAEQLADAMAKGAVVHCGGRIEELGGGLYCRPTVLTRVNHSMRLMQEETFGPIIPVMAFSTPDEAVRLANDTIYGLSAAVFAGSEAEALDVAHRLEAGAISINDAGLTAVLHEGEKSAFKSSGMGRSRMGPAGLTRFLQQKVFLMKTDSVSDPWWFEATKQ